jgi:RpiR family carbohydrate utilization transcriptional regulator
MDKKIQQQLEHLSPSEQRVGGWIVANMMRAIDASIQEVAEAAGVSQPTVMRFCRSMDTSGFRDLRKHLIAALQQPDSYSHHDVDIEDDSSSAAAKVVESSIRALVDLRSFVGTMPFDDAVLAMRSARQLVFAGVGASGQVVQDARHKFFRLGIPCSAALDAPTMRQQASIAQPNDVYIAVSHMGRWSDLVDSMAVAGSRGATIIAFTDPRSPLAKEASLIFGTHPTEDTSVFTPMTSRLTQLTLLDALQVALALDMGGDAEDNLRQTKLALLQPKANPERTLQ